MKRKINANVLTAASGATHHPCHHPCHPLCPLSPPVALFPCPSLSASSVALGDNAIGEAVATVVATDGGGDDDGGRRCLSHRRLPRFDPGTAEQSSSLCPDDRSLFDEWA